LYASMHNVRSIADWSLTCPVEPNDNMAAQAAMSRQQYPPISSYQTPQSNSPASISSPQHDIHGRPIYAFPPISGQPQPMYYGSQYQMQQTSQYHQHPQAPPHHQPMTSAPGILMSHQQHPQHQPHQQPQQPMQQTPQSVHSQPSMMDSKPQSIQRPSSVIAPIQGTPQTPSGPTMGSMPPGSAGSGPNSSAAPGPIPATTPLVVRQDNTGVQWIAFEYSRDRVKMEYTIRCDVESINIDDLTPEFKNANCVYPRACCGKNEYKGNRLHYESECNAVGWALAQLNPNLREKRGLIQRAVDSWRNSNQDPRLRSRRVRRQAKIHTRKSTMPSAASHPQGPPVLPPHGLPPGGGRQPLMGPGGSQMHHHGAGSEASDDVSGMFHPM
jgi:hypothetical protein